MNIQFFQVEYDSKADKFVGFVLPLNENGMPESGKFKNVSAKKLVMALSEQPKSSYVYTVMVQPLQQGAASFCICVFGTDNKFKTPDVKKRIDQIKQRLTEFGVTVLGVSSDGDSRLLKYMRLQINLGNENSDLPEIWKQYFYADISTSLAPIQDNLHILTKLRNVLTKPNSTLVIGKYAICSAFLINLIKQRPKGEHLLVMTDVIVKDKMNVTSAIKLFSSEVFDSLHQYHSQEAKGLILFLKIMENIYCAFESREITFEERVRKMWFCIFVLRIWKHIEPSGNFITLNAYTCIEINAHMIISVYVRLRDSANLKYFKPWYFNSQTCEKFFRTARSFTTTESTVINFSTNQFLHRIKRIQKLIELANSLDESNPPIELSVEPVTDEMILSYIEQAKSDAIQYMNQLEVEVDDSYLKIGIKGNPLQCKQESIEDCEDSDDDVSQLINNNEENLPSIPVSDEESESDVIDDDSIVQDCSGLLEECVNIVPKKGYFVLKNNKGKMFEIKKGSFLYAYQSATSHSTDRMFRFHTSHENSEITNRPSTSLNELKIDQWVIFKNFTKICHVLTIKVGKGLVNAVELPSSQSQNHSASIYCNLFDLTKNENGHLCLTLSNSRPQHFPLIDLSEVVSNPSQSDDGGLRYFDPEVIVQIEEILRRN